MDSTLKKTMLATGVALMIGTPSTEAALVTNVLGPYTWSTDSANFTLLSSNGGVIGGTNDINIQWDGSAYNASSDYTGPGSAANVTLSSTAPFFGHSWSMHDVQVFLPGSYSFDVALGGGNPEIGTLNATVGAGQLGMHMLWDWKGNNNIDVFVVFAQNSIFGSGLLLSTQTNTKGDLTCSATFTGTITKNCLYDGPLTSNFNTGPAPTKNQVWMLASADGNGDGIMGIPMAPNGPFAGFNANFNATLSPAPVPIPAAAWLFGSGLLSLAGVIRRKKSASSG
jgi:hypothetical protein